MIEQTTNENKQESLEVRDFNSNWMYGLDLVQSHPDLILPSVAPDIMKLDRDERIRLAVDELRIGQRIHDEMKKEGISVAWLAQQLGMERPNLYYTFRHNSISLELLVRISAVLSHNFLKDVNDIYQKYGL